MARLLTSAVLAVTFGAHDAFAQAEDPIVAAATAANVDATKLTEALLTVGEPDPFTYLRHTGELPTPQPAAPVPSVWTRLANCESNGRWHIASGNGYFGGLQQDMVFWRRYGGLAYAARPDLASPEQQVLVAQRGQASQGFYAWPVCARRLGLIP